jgi:hypothetical protein
MQPIHGELHCCRGELTVHGAATLAARDQTGIRQDVEMLHDRWQRHRKRLRQFTDREAFLLPQPGDQRPPGRIGKRRKHAIKAVFSIVNHKVNYRGRGRRLSTAKMKLAAQHSGDETRRPAVDGGNADEDCYIVQCALATGRSRRVTIGPTNVLTLAETRKKAEEVLAQFRRSQD